MQCLRVAEKRLCHDSPFAPSSFCTCGLVAWYYFGFLVLHLGSYLPFLLDVEAGLIKCNFPPTEITWRQLVEIRLLESGMFRPAKVQFDLMVISRGYGALLFPQTGICYSPAVMTILFECGKLRPASAYWTFAKSCQL